MVCKIEFQWAHRVTTARRPHPIKACRKRKIENSKVQNNFFMEHLKLDEETVGKMERGFCYIRALYNMVPLHIYLSQFENGRTLNQGIF